MTILLLLLGLAVGILVGLLGVGGGVVLVPALAYLLHLDQHAAQGTSLLILLPPVGLGALREYWKQGYVDLRAGILCAAGMLVGGYLGSLIAMPMPERYLKAFFGCFLMLAAVLLWRRAHDEPIPTNPRAEQNSVTNTPWRNIAIFVAALVCGVASGLFGIGGGVLLVPLLGVLFAFDQHRAQGTSLVALVPPAGLLAFLAYAKAGYVSWHTGLLLIPGIFLGGVAGGALVRHIPPRLMRQIFAGVVFGVGVWQVLAALRH
jgi:uncharacterized membrane protein YfcA